MPLSRESLTDDSFRRRILEEAPEHVELMDDTAFEASRQSILTEAEALDEFWVFAYGSLIWNPIIDIVDRRPARLSGHSRRFCVWAMAGRGTPDCPGLWLGLDRGGSCDGLALRVENDKRDHETLILWRREMIGGVYVPALVPIEIDGSERTGLVFLANADHARYARHVAHDDKVQAIAHAEGSMGTCREYLYSLQDQLSAHGYEDPYIERLAREVRTLALD